MIESVARSFPWMAACSEKLKDITNNICNHKEFSKSLHDMQKTNNVVHPLVLLHKSDTRKWSSGFLLTCRALQTAPIY